MGSVGASMATNPSPQQSTIPALDETLIDRANNAGIAVDFGDSTARTYQRNVEEIQSMDLTDEEKRNAIQKLHSLTEDQLKAEAGSLSPYSMGVGPARFNSQRMSRNADKAVNARQEVANHMDALRNEQRAKQRRAQESARAIALQNAIKNGDLEVTINGERWVRSSRRSKTFTRG